MAKLFFALKPTAKIREQIRQQRSNFAIAGQLVPDANIHLTVLYLGKISINQQQDILRCAALLKQPSFDLELDILSHFKHNNITWMGTKQTPIEILSLHQQLFDCGASLNIALENRHFKPHITLARKSQLQQRIEFSPIPWRVESFVLFESKQQRDGVYYQLVKEFELF